MCGMPASGSQREPGHPWGCLSPYPTQFSFQPSLPPWPSWAFSEFQHEAHHMTGRGGEAVGQGSQRAWPQVPSDPPAASPPPQYGIVLDAGSSHTSMFVYKWPADKENDTGIVGQHSSCDVQGEVSRAPAWTPLLGVPGALSGPWRRLDPGWSSLQKEAGPLGLGGVWAAPVPERKLQAAGGRVRPHLAGD